MNNKELIDLYYKNIKNNKNDAISYWRKIKKEKINIFSLNFTYLIKYIIMDLKENCRLVLHNIKILLKYFKVSIKFRKVNLKKYNILSDKETVDKIVNEGYSIARYGDGEFKWIFGIKQSSFQKESDDLTNRLLKNIQEYDKNTKILLGINDAMNDLSQYNLNARLYWKEYLIQLNEKLKKILPDRVYCDSYITRPYIDYKDKNYQIIKNKFDNLKRIWDGRNIVIVEGKYTKLGIGNDLFKNSKSIERIICPATDAFEKIDEIANAIRKQPQNKLILMSLGPTATVLAYDLSKEGYQCVDTGHIDIEYMWFLNGAKSKEEVDGKFVNEVSKKVVDKTDRQYESEIIERIKEK